MIELEANNNITIDDFESLIIKLEKISIKDSCIGNVDKSYNFLENYLSNHDKVIYGINTGFGPMAQYKIKEDEQIQLQYNLIRSHAAGAGQKLDDAYVKSAMFVRLCSILKGYSGVHPSTAFLLQELINNDVYPYIPEHGGVGASGDLVQLSHIALVLIGEGLVTYRGELRKTEDVFKELNLTPISIKIREGLSLINGTSVMTGVAAINVIKAINLLNWVIYSSALINEIVGSFDDYFSKELNYVKKHKGQRYIADIISEILVSSKLISKRGDYFYNNNSKGCGSNYNKRVQEYYSLRCVPQILGPAYDTIMNAREVIENEINSVSDNPIIDFNNKNVYHGGNFHGDYISLEMDKLKLSITKMSMLSERHLAFLCNPKINELLPPFVNLGKLGFNLGLQGMQFTATSTVAENQMLSNSMYVHSIPTNNDNQDMVSMGLNSAMMTKKVIDNAYQVHSITLIALLQAVDYLKVQDKLSDNSKKVYQQLRNIVPAFYEDTPKYEEIKNICDYIYSNNIE